MVGLDELEMSFKEIYWFYTHDQHRQTRRQQKDRLRILAELNETSIDVIKQAISIYEKEYNAKLEWEQTSIHDRAKMFKEANKKKK